MPTKLLFTEKHVTDVNKFNDNTSQQYSNLNLNQICSNKSSNHFNSKSNNDKKQFVSTVPHNNECNQKSQSFVKSSITDSFLKSYCTSVPQYNNKAMRSWRADENSFPCTSNSSTLSLHISAYENSNSFGEKEKDETLQKKNAKQAFIDLVSVVKNPFEFPRQQEEKGKANDPEIMQFKTSQKLFDSSQNGPNSYLGGVGENYLSYMKSSAKAFIAASSGLNLHHHSISENNSNNSFASLPKSYSNNGTTTTSTTKLLLNGSKDLRLCEACESRPIFSSFQEFAFHLRTQHCSKEGGSFVCRYGLNGVCQMLPVEGVSDEDYEKHIRKCHIKKSSNLQSTTQMQSSENDNNIDAGNNISREDNYIQRSASRASTIASSSTQQQREQFTVNSFTQNLSSVLSDPTRSKSETIQFFTRHWGDHYIPATTFPLPTSIPKISVEHFRQYLLTTAKNHRHYLRSKKALRKALALHYDQSSINIDELPIIFLDPLFALHDPKYFNSVFLEPLQDEIDQMISPAEKQRIEEKKLTGKGGEDDPVLSRAESSASLTSTFSLQAQMPPDALSGRSFRSYQNLHNRLEFYHDSVGALLNCQLESKSEEFWKTVNSYGALQCDIEGAKQKVTEIQSGLKSANENIVQKMKRVVEIHQERQNKVLLLQRLRDIACLRDAQTTVQMLLNQNDFPKALECIEMAQEVLHSDLKGDTVIEVDFRHLSTQLDELHKVIGRMLQDDFVALIQKEFGKPLEKESEIGYQEGQLHPVIHGLLRCGEFKFLQVLKHEIVEAVKNTIRQIIKNRIIEYGADLTEFDPSLLNWGDQMRKLNFEQWISTITAVFDSLILFCRRIISIQELILENVDRVIIFEENREKFMDKDEKESLDGLLPEIKEGEELPAVEGSKLPTSQSTANFHGITVPSTTTTTIGNGDIPRSASAATLISRKESTVSSVEDPQHQQQNSGGFISSAATMLSLPARDLYQVRSVLPCLLEHAATTAQERVGRLLIAKSKDGFLERCSATSFRKVDECVQKFVAECNELVQNQTSSTGLFASSSLQSTTHQGSRSVSPSPPSTTSTTSKSPLLHTMQQQATRLISRFHESRKQKLANILDSEQWKPASVPQIFQQIADHFCESGKLSDLINNDSNQSATGEETFVDYSAMPATDFIDLDGEKFYLVGTALILFRMIAQYSDLVEMFPDCAAEILLHVIEICKSFNSRTCQLILGAGALQFVGLKTISVKNLALAARCLQFILKFIQALKDEFKEILPPEKHHLLRHFDSASRDYQDHVDEIYSKLSSVIDFHIVSCLSSWQTMGEAPTPPFQQLIKQIGKFYNGFSSVMPSSETTKILLRVHSNLKSHYRNILNQHGVTPQNALSYGLASADFDYYIENMRALPNCENFPNDTINDVLS